MTAVPEHPVLVPGNAQALERVVLNLGDNAIKFSPDGGAVTLAVSTTSTGGAVCVEDAGIGMSEEDRLRAKERFYRSSAAYRRAVPGTGLGLSVVEAIVTAHAGTMSISSDLGRGTRVIVELPGAADA